VAITRQASRSRFTLLLLVLVSATLITLDLRGFAPLDGVRSEALDIFGPVKDAADSTFEPVGDAWQGALSYDELEAENQELLDRIAELEGELALSADAKVTLEALYDELDLDYVGDIETVVATVVSGPVSNFEHSIEIDKGRDDGVREGMAVVTSAGLVGTVEEVADQRSLVRLVSDPGFRVGIRLSDPDDIGVARGQGRDQDLLVFEGIDVALEVPEGTLVTTSGLAGTLFPPSVPIGTVRASVTSAGELDQDLFVEPLADLDKLSFVNVMLWVPEAGVAE
jgi:rod shape-determining protein MreC